MQGAATEGEGDEERRAPKMSVGRNDPVQINDNSPAHPRLDIENDLPFKTLVLAIIPAYVVAYF